MSVAPGGCSTILWSYRISLFGPAPPPLAHRFREAPVSDTGVARRVCQVLRPRATRRQPRRRFKESADADYLHLVATQIAKPKEIPPPGPGDLGFRTIFSDDLRDKHTNTLVGQHTAGSVCSSGRTRTCGCATTGFILPKGELIAEVLSNEDPVWTAAILGGTDNYDNARGQIEGKYIAGTGPPKPPNP